MKLTELQKIAGITNIVGPLADADVLLTSDSRNIRDENVFICLRGENFDAFDYIGDVVNQNVSVIIYTDAPGRQEKINALAKNYQGKCFIAVNDSLRFLQDAAAFWVRRWQRDYGGIVLGLTGSNGKTTTKEMLYHFAQYAIGQRAMCTQGNFNNHIGVALTIFNIRRHHRFAIVEMGTNHFGEIKRLCEIANPNFGLITNIGASHLEFLENESGVFKEKSALYHYIMDNGGRFFINFQDTFLKTLPVNERTIPFAEDLQVEENLMDSSRVKESYNRLNFAFAYRVMTTIFSNLDMSEAIATFTMPENKRSQWLRVKGKQVFLDAYNANPSSMRSALESFSEEIEKSNKHALYVLGDMNELGELTEEYHQEISKHMNSLNIENAVFIGKFAKYYAEAFSGDSETYPDREAFTAQWQKVLDSYDYIFLKASRSLQLEQLLDIT